jgi:hypothetical protein
MSWSMIIKSWFLLERSRGQISVQGLSIRSEMYRNFSKSLQKIYPQYLKLYQNNVLPHSFHFIILQFDAVQAELIAVLLREQKH